MSGKPFEYKYLKPRGCKDFRGINLYQKIRYWYNNGYSEKIDFYTYMVIYESVKSAGNVQGVMSQYIKHIMNDTLLVSEVIEQIKNNYGLVEFSFDEHEYLKNCINEFIETHKDKTPCKYKYTSSAYKLRVLFNNYLKLDRSVTENFSFTEYEEFMNLQSSELKNLIFEKACKNPEYIKFMKEITKDWHLKYD